MNTAGSAIAVAQFAPTADPAANLESMRVLVERAAARGATLVVFPEYSSYFEPQLSRGFVDAAEPVDGPFVTGLAAIAARSRVHIVAGLVESTTDAARFSNTLVALSPEGEPKYLNSPESPVFSKKRLLYGLFEGRESIRKHDRVVLVDLRRLERRRLGRRWGRWWRGRGSLTAVRAGNVRTAAGRRSARTSLRGAGGRDGPGRWGSSIRGGRR